MNNPLRDTNIQSVTDIPTPRELETELPASPKLQRAIVRFREEVGDILSGTDGRLLAIVGPCSIHDTKAGLEYAQRLASLSRELDDELRIVMRVYFEKPRSMVGWKGLISDPDMNGTFDVEKGLRLARRFLLDVASLGLPAGTEVLDPILPQYFLDLVSWAVIGVRTSESQIHREIASGLSMPVGFKNATDGTLDSPISAMKLCQRPQHFLGATEDGTFAVFETNGNEHPHLVLRGHPTPNYGSRHIARTEEALRAAKLPLRIIVDCSHGNSEGDPRRQADVLRDVLSQIENGNTSILGIMLESNLEWSCQPIQANRDRMDYGVSVTDPCMDWDTTAELLREAHDAMARVRRH